MCWALPEMGHLGCKGCMVRVTLGEIMMFLNHTLFHDERTQVHSLSP